MTRASASSLLLLLVAAGALPGCAQRVQRQPYEMIVRVYGDPGEPLPGARLMHGSTLLGVSGTDGAVGVKATGKEGERILLQVLCPEGHRSPSEPLSLTLRRPAERTRRPEYNASCSPLTRKLVVAVRADKGPNLPVRHLGREVARTDASGAAHVVLDSAPLQNLELLLDTSEQPRLRPQNPTARFRVGDRDELVLLNQAFQSSAPQRSRVARPSGPVRIR